MIERLLEHLKAYMIRRHPSRVFVIPAVTSDEDRNGPPVPWLQWSALSAEAFDRRMLVEPYIIRLVLIPHFVYVHQIWESDTGPLHNHPANAISFLLVGKYLEQFFSGEAWRHAGSIRRIHRDTFHRLWIQRQDRGHVWTLFMFGRRDPRGWGFMPSGIANYEPSL